MPRVSELPAAASGGLVGTEEVVGNQLGDTVRIFVGDIVSRAVELAVDAVLASSAIGGGGGGGSGGVELRGLTFTSDTGSTADSDPGNGLFKWNNATEGSATVLYFDNQTVDAVSLTSLWSNLPQQGTVYIQQGSDETLWQLWRFTAHTDGTGYRKLTVTLLAKSSGDIADDELCLVDLVGDTSSVGRHAIYIAAGSMRPTSASGCAPLATLATSSGQPDINSLDFDTTTQEFAQFSIVMPKSWDEGTVTFVPHWSHASTTTNFGVVWQLQGVAVSNDDAIGASFGTAQTSTDTGGTTNDLYSGPESSAITIAGTPASLDMVFFRLGRVPADGSDTLAIDARLHGITLYITTDAANDA